MQNFGELSDAKFKTKIKSEDLKSFINSLVHDFHSLYDPTKDCTDSLSITSKMNLVLASIHSENTTEPAEIQSTHITEVESAVTANQFCIAKYNYNAQQDGDLSFQKGDRIKILDQRLKEWWKGEINGVMGLFPHNYVKLETD